MADEQRRVQPPVELAQLLHQLRRQRGRMATGHINPQHGTGKLRQTAGEDDQPQEKECGSRGLQQVEPLQTRVSTGCAEARPVSTTGTGRT